MARVNSIQVGRVRLHSSAEARDRKPPTWETAFWKEPVGGPVRVGRLGIEGDEQADRRFNGGPDKAVLAYAAEHYPVWRAELNVDDSLCESRGPLAERVDYIPGGFGENLTIEGLTEGRVCIGDTWQVGDVLLQVSQPRQPCWKLGRRWGMPGLPKRVIATGRTGWYCRVLSEGTIEAGMDVVLVERPRGEWTVSAANAVMYARPPDPKRRAALAGVEELAESWREELLCERGN